MICHDVEKPFERGREGIFEGIFNVLGLSVLVENYTTLSIWAGESQSGNPIGSELVI